MDEQLNRAYRDLAGSIVAPSDATERVVLRQNRRRRHRHAGYAALSGAAVCAVLVAVLAIGDGGPTERPAQDPANAPSTTEPTLPVVVPAEVTCPDGSTPNRADFDHPGYDTFTQMLAAQAQFRGAFVVDRAAETLYFLREDGTAHTAVPWTGDPRKRQRWFPSGQITCADHQEWASVELDQVTPSEPVSLELGHCWIEPVQVFGGSWEVLVEDQFGSGGQFPRGFSAAIPKADGTLTGTAWRTGDVVTYIDDGGAQLTLVPEGDPWARDREVCK